MGLGPPKPIRTDTRFPYTRLFRSDVLARRNELRPRRFRPIGSDQTVGDGVIDDEGIGPRKRGDVAVGAVHRVALEDDDRSGVAGRCNDPVFGGRFSKDVLVRPAIFLLLLGNPTLVFRRFTNS